MPAPQRIVDRAGPRAASALWPLHDAAASRRCEAQTAQDLPPHTLMQRAGIAVARLALALAPHAERIWILAGPGNNGGDGLEAAALLCRAGKRVAVSLLASASMPADAAAALARARDAGVKIETSLAPPEPLRGGDLAVDALFGLGLGRAPAGAAALGIASLNAGAAPVLAVDLPSGLDADHGRAFEPCAIARWTLALLTLKPGLFTAAGRDHAGDIWFDDLGVCADPQAAVATLVAAQPVDWPARPHASHKGTHGDAWIVGGAPGMAGAAALAARAASAAGAGRVLRVSLDPAVPHLDLLQPELMHRPASALPDRDIPLETSTVVVGCGGGTAVRELLPVLISRSGRLLLDADALNALAADPSLARAVTARAGRDRATVLTPHPLEAARLLGIDKTAVQADRRAAAQRLADRLAATVVLKGSGSIVASAGQHPRINASGNAALATAGTGDVLAGWIAGLWTQGLPAADAAALGVYTHGLAAETGRADDRISGPLEASRLIDRLRALRA
ncbi:NAD(P)H-hydrate dehydratase [uncultured Methylibium sp.]|uniref:NAD(P)H-hydrate dehydratase n=1 Tax=uncultured Methylibium sp. TaxID=381093 RepID=UPI0025E7ECFC|nr:NAD(P)H-hydrate dehydratase [uncultured Methylibium sp.]